jgi:hypothetical protein
MKERHQEKNGKNETRARALAAHDRNYWVGLLKTVDTWFPVYRVRHPDVDRAEIVAHLASLVDERRRRGFPDDERPAPPAIPDTAVLFESPLARRGIRGILDTPFATTSGVAKASAFKLIDLEIQSKADTPGSAYFLSPGRAGRVELRRCADGLGFPDPEAFGFSSAFSFFSSTHKFQGQDADMSRTEVLFPGDKPSLFLGMRWTFAGADTRMQTGFTQQALSSFFFFGFRRLDTGVPGVHFSYDPELVVTQ